MSTVIDIIKEPTTIAAVISIIAGGSTVLYGFLKGRGDVSNQLKIKGYDNFASLANENLIEQRRELARRSETIEKQAAVIEKLQAELEHSKDVIRDWEIKYAKLELISSNQAEDLAQAIQQLGEAQVSFGRHLNQVAQKARTGTDTAAGD